MTLEGRTRRSGDSAETGDPQAAIRDPKSTIRVLPPEVVNRIAAGEVVERPASILKELVENSVDANSTEITVVLEEGGKKRILVRDNGRGMTPEDLPLAFQSHATSKLKAEDLHANTLGSSSLGFRGEALASIGAVGMVEVVSRTPWVEHASRYRPGAGEPEPAAGEPGTTVEVRDLFYNVPARRKFLRTGSTELSHCVQQFLRIAMGCPAIHMRLSHGKRSMMDFPAVDRVGERLRQILPRKISDHLVEVAEGHDPELPHLEGFIGEPCVHRRDTKEQHFFVGGRWVRDRTLTHALRSAYQGFLIPGHQPVAYLYLDCPRGDVDANVHPTKTEVRFRDSSAMYRLVHHAVRRGLESSPPPEGLGAASDRAGPEVADDVRQKPSRYTTRDLFAEITGSTRKGLGLFGRSDDGATDRAVPRSPDASPPASRGEGSARHDLEIEEDLEPAESDEAGDSSSSKRPARETEEDKEAGPATPGEPTVRRPISDSEPVQCRIGPAAASSGRRAGEARKATEPSLDEGDVLQVMNSYLVVDLSDRVVFMDQHALHEIILFEEIYRRLIDGVVESQRLMVPEVIRVPAEYLPLVERAAELLQRFGFEMETFGPDSVALHAIPSIFDREAGRTDLTGLVCSVLESLQEGLVATSAGRVGRERGIPLSLDEQLRDIGATIACKRAVKAGMPLSQEEIRSLLRRAGAAVDPRHCPHGRPTAVSYSKQEIERMFDRR